MKKAGLATLISKISSSKQFKTYRRFLVVILLIASAKAQSQSQYCVGSTAVPVFLETFGSGNNPGPALPAGITNYSYVKGWPTDGWYTIWNTSNPNLGGDPFWHNAPDHTGDPNGYMMVVNAGLSKGEFYRKKITGLCPNVTYYFSLWAANANNPNLTTLCGGACVQSDILIKIENAVGGTVLNSITTGVLPRVGTLTWKEYGFSFAPTAGQTAVNIVLVNNGPGGDGNDLVIDDISFKVCLPNVKIAAPPICPGENVIINGTVDPGYNNPVMQWQTSTDGGITWVDIPGATTANLSLTNVTPTNPAPQYRLLVAENGNIANANCRFVSNSVTIKVTPLVTSIDTVGLICGVLGSASVTVLSGTPAYSYQWSNGATTTAITGLTPGIYSVTVTDSKGCTKVDNVTINSSGSVIANVGPASSICIGMGIPQILIVTSIGGINYIWSTGETTTSISVLPSSTTTYTVIASTNQCADTVEVTVTVNPLPIAKLSGNNVCFTNANTFTNSSIGNNTFTQVWDFGDGNTSTLLNPTHIYGSPGTYIVSLIITNNFGCKDTNNTLVVVNPLPTVNFSSVPVCFKDTTCFKDLSTITKGSITGWSWNFNDPSSGANNISNLQNPCHQFTGLGPFNVILTITSDSGCQSITNRPVTINPPPVALFINSSVCLNVATDFTSTSTSSAADPINVWNWNFGDGAISGLANPSHIYTTAGTYTVTLIVTTAGGCKDTIYKPVTVHQLPVADFTGNAAGCMPVCVTNYTDSSTCSDLSIATWHWSFPGGSPAWSSQKKPPTICYSSPGSYGASLTVTSNYGCTDSIAITPLVNVYSLPKADFCVAPLIAPATDPVFNFCDMWSKDVAQWTWDFGDGSALDSVNTDPAHSYSATANQNDFYNYKICINVQTQYGCKDAICHSVELVPEFIFYIPNTFTPNGDGTNEMFYGKCRGVKEYNIWVFDRWGNQLWDCHKEDKNTNWDSDATTPKQEGLASACQWDGIVVQGGMDMNGNSRQFAQQDVYIWKVHLTDVFNKRHSYIGHVNVVK